MENSGSKCEIYMCYNFRKWIIYKSTDLQKNLNLPCRQFLAQPIVSGPDYQRLFYKAWREEYFAVSNVKARQEQPTLGSDIPYWIQCIWGQYRFVIVMLRYSWSRIDINKWHCFTTSSVNPYNLV